MDDRELKHDQDNGIIKVCVSDTMRSCYEMDMKCDLDEFIHNMSGEPSDVSDLFEYFDLIIEAMYHLMEKSLKRLKSMNSIKNHPIMEESLSVTDNLM